ncbi:MAG: protoporphyrinogen oxidase [Nitrospiraceae bacterium]
MSDSPAHVAIVGGGIAGLATAFSLQERAAEAGIPLACTLIESDREWGGKIVTHRVGDALIEAGPDSFLSQKPWALQLCAKLGLSDRVMNTNEAHKKTYVFSRGRLRELPEGLVVIAPAKLGSLLRSGLLSWPGVARMALDLVLPARRADGDESLASFFRRRVGREVFQRVIEPLMAGIYAGDAEQISLKATFPRFLEMEREHGSLIRGMLAGRKSAPSSGLNAAAARTMFVTLRDGLGEMVRVLVARIREAGVTMLSEHRVMALRVRSTRPGTWTYDLLLESGQVVTADAVVLATPAYVTADLVRSLSPTAAGALEAIPYASTATISLMYGADEVASLKGFGFVVPRAEGRALLAATWTSSKWAHRAPPSQALVRAYVGGVGRETILKTDDDTMVRHVREELQSMAGITALPSYVRVHRWERGMPQYTLGHLERLETIQSSLSPYRGLYLTGAAYRGIGIPDCIRDGSDMAEAVVRYVTSRETRPA